MCTSPLTILNPSHFISLDKRDRLFIQVPCGRCPDCRDLNSLQWYQRAIVEFDACVSSGGYCLFDTLTYSNSNLPHFSDFFETTFDFPCFNRKHVTDFLKRLRASLKRKFNYDGLRYYLVSEYGTSPLHSHRPHYHVLFYCDSIVPPEALSSLISSCWRFGRTDGIPYQSSNYVLSSRVYTSLTDKSKFQVIQYVSKYVNKSCEFEKEIWQRVQFVLDSLTSNWSERELSSYRYKQLKRSVYNTARQFHRQSVGFGAQILRDVDLLELASVGGFKVSLPNKLVCIVPLSTYYKRKLFYEVVSIDGSDVWQLNDVGIEFVPIIEKRKFDNFLSRFHAVDASTNFKYSSALNSHNYSVDDFANYALNLFGCVKSFAPVYRVTDKLNDNLLFHYGCECDEKHYGFRFYSRSYLGNKCSGYLPPKDIVSLDYIKAHYMISDKFLDGLLQEFYSDCSINNCDAGRYSLMVLKERLLNLYRQFL